MMYVLLSRGADDSCNILRYHDKICVTREYCNQNADGEEPSPKITVHSSLADCYEIAEVPDDH